MLLRLRIEWAFCAVEVVEKYMCTEILVAHIIWAYTEDLESKCLSYYYLTSMCGAECSFVWNEIYTVYSVYFKSRCSFWPGGAASLISEGLW